MHIKALRAGKCHLRWLTLMSATLTARSTERAPWVINMSR